MAETNPSRRNPFASRRTPTATCTGSSSSRAEHGGAVAAPRDGREGGRRPAPRLRAQAQLVRPRRRHRARRRDPAPPLRAPRGARASSSRAARTASSAPARTSTCSAARRTRFKVNFCKFTNETRLYLEDVSAESGIPSLCALNGTASGGGYELASPATRSSSSTTASSAVSFPEVPLLARAPRHRRPHAPRRQAQGPPRPRRRVLTIAEGVTRQARGRVGPRRRGARRRRSSTRSSKRRARGARRAARSASRFPAMTLAAARGEALRRQGRVQVRHRSTLDAKRAHRDAHGARARRQASPTTPDGAREGRRLARGPCTRSASSTTRSSTSASTSPTIGVVAVRDDGRRRGRARRRRAAREARGRRVRARGARSS